MLDITVKAPEDASVSEVAAIKADLMNALGKAGKNSKIVLDMTETKHADSSMAQLIIALQMEAIAKDLKVEIRGEKQECSMHALLCCDNDGESCVVRQKSQSNKSGGAS